MIELLGLISVPGIPHLTADQGTLDTILKSVYSVAGAVAVVFVIVGAIRYILSGGNASSIAKAKNTITFAIVGLIIVVLAFAITNFILGGIRIDTFDNLRSSVINVLLYAAGAISIIMVVFGAFRYVTSGGNSAAVTAAKNTILYAIIGLVIAVLAFAIVNFVIGNL